ncbi:protein BASIC PENTACYSTEINE2-like [Aristolochia californica]|uniref:protein BASIC PENTACYSTEINE2-like n=1 Tax=Aristolochia californica TaxID=171875 RepID=UPI0035D56D4F
MDDDGGLGIRNWGYYEQSLKGNLGLQLMSSVAERDAKPLLSGRDPSCMVPANGAYLHRDCGVPEAQVPMDFVRESWIAQREKFLHVLPSSQSYALAPVPSGSHHLLQIPPHPESIKNEHVPLMEDAAGKRDGPLKKRSNGRAYKSPKTKKTRKVGQKEESNCSVSRAKTGKKSTAVVINGIDMDISGIPIPVCSCTGTPQQCYKWGVGGWQSACCTTSISMYPLPMSTKRRGARIAGRKMSQGAFKKVLEKLASEGHNLSNPIDLKTHWAKHGTNKFVTIR